MKGVSYITDKKTGKRSVDIELKTLLKYPERVEDLLDNIVAEGRQDEEKFDWEAFKEKLKGEAEK